MFAGLHSNPVECEDTVRSIVIQDLIKKSEDEPPVKIVMQAVLKKKVPAMTQRSTVRQRPGSKLTKNTKLLNSSSTIKIPGTSGAMSQFAK